jgi:hypothetical protein
VWENTSPATSMRILAVMAQALDRRRPYPSDALSALFGPVERWGWALEKPVPFTPSPLRCSPPQPRPGEDYAATYLGWRESIETEEADSWTQASKVASWSARRPDDEYSLAVLFGGTATGWHALLTTLGGSILGSGSRLNVVNLSERAVTPSLKTLARKCGYRVRIDTVAPSKTSFDLLSFVGHGELIDFVIDVIHHEGETTAEAREDRALLRSVAGAMTEPPTSERLWAGLRVLLRESGPPGPGDPLTPAEYQRMSSLFGEQRRQHTDVVARASRLEHELSDFVALERSARHAAPESARDPEDLRILEAARTPDRLDFDFSVRILISAMVRRMMRPPSTNGRDLYLIVGADRLNRRLIQSLSDLAEEGGARLVMLFAHLRDDALDALGSGNAAIAFMRLTDHREAAQASSFIGEEEKFVISQTTRTRSESYEQSRGRSTSDERGQSGARSSDFSRTLTESVGHSDSTNVGSSRGESFTASETDQRVEEPIAKPHVLQSLPETGLLLVNLQTRAPVFADCDPTIVLRPA